MDQQNIDRLFREKLDDLEITPSSNSWSQVESKIGRKRKPIIYYWVAASVSLLLVSWIVWPGTDMNQSLTPIASEISYPPQMELRNFSFPEIVSEQKKVKPKEVAKKKNVHLVAQKEDHFQHQKTKTVIPDAPELATKTIVVNTDIETPKPIKKPILESTGSQFKKVKITYIASTFPKEDEIAKEDSTGVFKKVIAFAGKIDPGDMLADIKTAKDNLLNGGLKNKKDRNSL